MRNFDALTAQLQAAGSSVERDPAEYSNGRFASLLDPEGNGIQLRQPAGTDAGGP